MTKRKPLSKKVRFDVFKRDYFQCQYCGNTPPSIVLEVDHIHPVSKGGDNDIDNLITACFDCNRGKRAESLNSIPQTLSDKTEMMLEKEAQLSEYKKIKTKISRRKNREVEKLNGLFNSHFKECTLNKTTKIKIKSQFLPHIDIDDLLESMEFACSRLVGEPDEAYLYFCGICWNKIRENSDG